MKRIGNLITEERITIDFCKNAIYEASRNKHKRESILRVLDNIDEYAERLRELVLNNTFEPSPHTYEKRIENGKVRELMKPRFFPDQCVHHILIMLIRDRIIKRIDPYAVASIPGRGQSKAFKSIVNWIKHDKEVNTRYVIKGDIEKFFGSVTPKVIMDYYNNFIKDKKYLELKRKVVYSTSSLPLGNYCSAYDANLILKGMDELIRGNETVKHYVRYMDDFVAFCSNRRKAKLLYVEISNLLSKLGLKIKSTYQLFKFSDRGLDFVGYRFFRNVIILRKRNYRKIIKQLNRIAKLKVIPVKECHSFVSRIGTAKHCHSNAIFRKVNTNIKIWILKNIIRENSRLETLGKIYTPSMMLI